MMPIEMMNDEQLNNLLIAAKKEQQRRKDEQIADVKEQITQKINEIIDLAEQMEECGICVELEIESKFECRGYRLPNKNLNIIANVFPIYKDGE